MRVWNSREVMSFAWNTTRVAFSMTPNAGEYSASSSAAETFGSQHILIRMSPLRSTTTAPPSMNAEHSG
jgi:hypothetical protein